jgi:erythromycin esterase-like protein
MSAQWQREVAGVLRWLRTYNARHADKLHFVGVDYYLLGREAYTWERTVAGLTTSRAAISSFVSPVATSATTSRSRRVSRSGRAYGFMTASAAGPRA